MSSEVASDSSEPITTSKLLEASPKYELNQMQSDIDESLNELFAYENGVNK